MCVCGRSHGRARSPGPAYTELRHTTWAGARMLVDDVTVIRH